MKRFVTLLLCLLMVTSIFFACSNEPETPPTQTTPSGSDTTVDDGRYHADVPAKNYDGAEFIIMTRSTDSGWYERAIFGEAEDETVLGASTWQRNEQVMGEFGIEFVFEQVHTTIQGGTFYEVMLQNMQSQEYLCDVANLGLLDAMNLLPSGILLNLQDVPYIDLEQPWWAQKSNASIALLNRQYFAINDMLLNDKLDSYALFFNKKLFDDNNLTYPYELVESGDWTFAEFRKLLLDFGYDMNNNSRKDFEDQYGMSYQRIDSFFSGFGIIGATLDENGLPEMTDFSDRIQTAYDLMYNLRNSYDWNVFGYWDDQHMDDPTQHYLALYPRSLFVCGPISHYIETIPHVEDPVGVVPSPKLDENQKEYITRAGSSGTTVITVPSTCKDRERAGIIIEALGAAAKNYTSPAFYETLLTNRYAQDEESKAMLGIIIETEIIDLDTMTQWGWITRQLENNVKGKNNAVASTYAKLYPAAVEKMNQYIDKISSIE